MQFWKVEILKRRLASRAMPQRELFLYLLVWVTIDAIFMGVDTGRPNTWDQIGSVLTILAVVLGTTYGYVRNGGSAGSDFLARYLALSWVVGIRFLVLVVLPSVLGYFVICELVSEVHEETGVGDTLLILVLEIGYYLRLAHHIRDVARGDAAA